MNMEGDQHLPEDGFSEVVKIKDSIMDNYGPQALLEGHFEDAITYKDNSEFLNFLYLCLAVPTILFPLFVILEIILPASYYQQSNARMLISDNFKSADFSISFIHVICGIVFGLGMVWLLNMYKKLTSNSLKSRLLLFKSDIRKPNFIYILAFSNLMFLVLPSLLKLGVTPDSFHIVTCILLVLIFSCIYINLFNQDYNNEYKSSFKTPWVRDDLLNLFSGQSLYRSLQLNYLIPILFIFSFTGIGCLFLFIDFQSVINDRNLLNADIPMNMLIILGNSLRVFFSSLGLGILTPVVIYFVLVLGLNSYVGCSPNYNKHVKYHELLTTFQEKHILLVTFSLLPFVGIIYSCLSAIHGNWEWYLNTIVIVILALYALISIYYIGARRLDALEEYQNNLLPSTIEGE